MLTIGKLGDAAGVKVPTICYYEQIDLLPEPDRSSGNQRLYARSTLDRLSFIRHARELGFPLEAIRDLLSLQDSPDQPCTAADTIAKAQLLAVRARLARLKALEIVVCREIDLAADLTLEPQCRRTSSYLYGNELLKSNFEHLRLIDDVFMRFAICDDICECTLN